VRAAVSETDQAKAALSPQSEIKGVPMSGDGIFSGLANGTASPEEGAALIRAFLRIKDASVRVAVVELVTRLSQASL
jgi:hypothetical protein